MSCAQLSVPRAAFSKETLSWQSCTVDVEKHPNGFQGRASVRPGTARCRLPLWCDRQHHEHRNLFLTIWRHAWHERSKERQPARSPSPPLVATHRPRRPSPDPAATRRRPEPRRRPAGGSRRHNPPDPIYLRKPDPVFFFRDVRFFFKTLDGF